MAQCARLANHLERADAEDVSLSDVAYTLAEGRRAFSHRVAIAAGTREDAIAQLRKTDAIRSRATTATESPRVAMLFPGQGTQYPGMAEDLYHSEPFYRDIVDDCCRQLRSLTGLDLMPVIFPAIVDAEDKEAWEHCGTNAGTNKVCAAGAVRYQLCVGEVVDALGCCAGLPGRTQRWGIGGGMRCGRVFVE